MLSPNSREQQILDSIEQLSATGKLSRKRQVAINQEDDTTGSRNKDDTFQALVNDLVAKPSRRASKAYEDDPRRRAALIEQQQKSSEALKKRRNSGIGGSTSSHPGSGSQTTSPGFGRSTTNELFNASSTSPPSSPTSPSSNNNNHITSSSSAPYENLVTQYESASNNLPANIASRFQDSIMPGAQQLAIQVEQWVSAEGLGSGGGGGGRGGGVGAIRGSKRRASAGANTEDNDADSNIGVSTKLLLGAAAVGLSNAAKSRLRNLLEQGLTEFVHRLQSTVLSETEAVNVASAQIVTRGGHLNHECDSLRQELAVAKKEISRINEAAALQEKEMRQMETESKSRDEQFDLVRQQLSSREEMLRESTSTFRKELNRFRSRISDLEAELDRKNSSSSSPHHHSVVGHWGYRSSSSSTAETPQHHFSPQSTNSGGGANGNALAGTLRPGMRQMAFVSAEPDPRGVLAAASQMDQLGGGGSPTAHHHHNNNNTNASFDAHPSMNNLNASLDSRDNTNNNQNQNYHGGNTEETTSTSNQHLHISPAATHHQHQTLSTSSMSSAARNVFSANDPSNTLLHLNSSASSSSPSSAVVSVPHILQLASSVGMEEAVNEMRKEFEKKLFRAKERLMLDKKDAVSRAKSEQELTILKLKRDVEQKERKLAELKEKYGELDNQEKEQEGLKQEEET